MPETRRLALIGVGAIGRSILAREPILSLAGLQLTDVCARPDQIAGLRAVHPDVRFTTSVDTILETSPDILIEAAGQGVIQDYAEEILKACRQFYVLSVGALADQSLFDRLSDTARRHRSQIILPCGALAGFDGLRSLKLIGDCDVTYISRKPPRAWKGTLAESLCDLDALTAPEEFFRGSARDAARRFPKNANLAACVALAGIGFDATHVRLCADPDAQHNVAQLLVRHSNGEMMIEMAGASFAENPKSSVAAGASVVAAMLNSAADFSFR